MWYLMSYLIVIVHIGAVLMVLQQSISYSY